MNEYGLRELWLNEYKKNEMLYNRDGTIHQRKTAPAAVLAAYGHRKIGLHKIIIILFVFAATASDGGLWWRHEAYFIHEDWR